MCFTFHPLWRGNAALSRGVKKLGSSDLPRSAESALATTDITSQAPSESIEDRVSKFLDSVLPAVTRDQGAASALIPWICDVLPSDESVAAYGHDLAQFLRRMESQGVAPFQVRADHIKVYKASLLKSGVRPSSIARKLSVLRGVYQQFAKKGLIGWEAAQEIGAVSAPPVKKNITPALTQEQAVSLLRAIPTDTLLGLRDSALIQTFFITGCRVSALIRARVGDLEFDGAEHYLHVTEKRNKESRKVLLDAARAVLAYIDATGVQEDADGPLFRPLAKDGARFERRHLSRKTPWRIVKKYCRIAGVNPDRQTGPGVGVHTLRKTAINDAIRNGAQMHEVREFAGHSDIRTTELYFVRREEDAEMAARRIRIRLTTKRT